MPRPLREHDQFCINHVMMRGNRKANIFFKEDDYQFFCSRLKSATDRFACSVHLFCLMTNHVHIVIETSHISLSKIMQSINASYAGYIHRELEAKGTLYEDRYKAKEVTDDRYMIELCHYVHKNPVEAGIVKHINDYPWSSHFAYINKSKWPWLETQHVLSLLKKHVKSATPYDSFMHERDSCYESIYTGYDRDGFLINNEDLTTKRKKRKSERLMLSHLSVEDFLNIVCDEMQLSKTKVISSSRNSSLLLARSLVVHFAHNFGSIPLYQIAPVLNRSPDGLTKTMSKVLFSDKKEQDAEYWLNRMYQVFDRSAVRIG